MSKILFLASLTYGLNLVCTCVLALPIWLLWTVCGLSRYFVFLPTAWQSIPFLHVVGLMLLLGLLSTAVQGVKIKASA